MEICKISDGDEQLLAKEKIRDLLVKLQILKDEVSELRLCCEELKKQHLPENYKMLVCSECGKPIEKGQEIIVRDAAGREWKHYHKDCFKSLWL